MQDKFIQEMYLATLERTIKRLWILCILLVLLLVGSNAAWIYYENSFEDTVITQDVDSGDGGDAIINDGVHVNGKSETSDKNQN